MAVPQPGNAQRERTLHPVTSPKYCRVHHTLIADRFSFSLTAPIHGHGGAPAGGPASRLSLPPFKPGWRRLKPASGIGGEVALHKKLSQKLAVLHPNPLSSAIAFRREHPRHKCGITTESLSHTASTSVTARSVQPQCVISDPSTWLRCRFNK